MSRITKDRSDAFSYRSEDIQSVMSVRTKAARRVKWSSEFNFIAVLINYTLSLQSTRAAPTIVLRSNLKLVNMVVFPTLLMVIGTPIMFMQLALGQYSGRTTIMVWDVCPAFRGVGIASFVNFMFYQVYNLMWCTYCLFYTFIPFIHENDWTSCNKSWAHINCYTSATNISQYVHCYKELGFAACTNMTWYSSTQMYWLFYVLQADRQNWEFGTLNYKLMPYGFAAAMLTYLANFNGVRTVESSLCFLFFLPFTMMGVLLFMCSLHPGAFAAFKGIKDTNFSEFADPEYWALNIAVITYISSIGFGNNIVFGAQCNFRTPIHFKAYVTIVGEGIFVFLNSAMTIMMSGIVDYELNGNVWKAMKTKESIMFTLLPDAVAHLYGNKWFWIFFYYLHSFLFGFRCQVLMVCNTLDIFYDMRPRLKRRHRELIFFWCMGTFLVSILLYCQTGNLYLSLIERFVFFNAVPVISAMQVFAIAYVYGVGKFCDDASFMLGSKVPTVFRVSYLVFPFVFLSTFVFATKNFYGDQRGRYKKMPSHVWHTSNFCLWSGVVYVFIYFTYYSLKHYAFKKGKNPFVPTADWGPCERGLEKSRQMYSAHSMTKEYMYRQERFKKHKVTT